MVTVGPYQAVSFNWKGIISEMPPVEGNSFVDASVLPPVMELKVVDKAMQGADVVGFKLAVFAKDDKSGLRDLQSVINDAAGRGKPMPEAEKVTKLLMPSA